MYCVLLSFITGNEIRDLNVTILKWRYSRIYCNHREWQFAAIGKYEYVLWFFITLLFTWRLSILSSPQLINVSSHSCQAPLVRSVRSIVCWLQVSSPIGVARGQMVQTRFKIIKYSWALLIIYWDCILTVLRIALLNNNCIHGVYFLVKRFYNLKSGLEVLIFLLYYSYYYYFYS